MRPAGVAGKVVPQQELSECRTSSVRTCWHHIAMLSLQSRSRGADTMPHPHSPEPGMVMALIEAANDRTEGE